MNQNNSKPLLNTIQNLNAYIARCTDMAEIDLIKKMIVVLSVMVMKQNKT